ncbi:MAG: hypothetical protein AABW49_03945 [Nanoarchaeota archaeon]
MSREEEILRKYQYKLGGDTGGLSDNETFSREYEIFREEALDNTDTFYARIARKAGRIITVNPKPEEEEKLQESIEWAHLTMRPSDATSLAALTGLMIIVLAIASILLQAVLFYMSQNDSALLGSINLFLPLFVMLLGAIIIRPLSKYPHYVASKWRLRVSNQMVLCILYIVMYMRHTSNLEHAIKFAGLHVGQPLSLDLRKVFWDVAADKYSTIKESLDAYLSKWQKYNLEFVESFNLISGSLSEPNETRRVQLLEKSLDVMLDGTYDKMLHFAHELKSPLTILYYLGILLPILGLVIFPLISALLSGLVKWYHLAILYNLLIPLGVYFLGYNILSKRSTGYGDTSINNQFKFYNPPGLKLITGFLITIFLAAGFLPIILHLLYPGYDPILFEGSTFIEGRLLDYKCDYNVQTGAQSCVGPYGLFSLILSLLIPLGVGLGIGMYYKAKTKELILIRNKTKDLETEFIGSLFQLGNRIADGIPVEVAFSKVLKDMKGTPSGEFFSIADYNMKQLGMSLEDALFDKKYGAVNFFPSSLVQTSMRILTEGAGKGPQAASKSMISISAYVDRINKVNQRLRDLLAEITTGMKTQVTFMTPLIAGIVVGVSSMLVNILNQLGEKISQAQGSQADLTSLQTSLSAFNIENVIPSFFFQVVVGVFVLEVGFVLTYLSSTIENGVDWLAEKHALGKSLVFGMLLYSAISFFGIIIFAVLAGGLGNFGGT